MEKTTLKARKDREELQRELDDLTGRSRGDALRATEVMDFVFRFLGDSSIGWLIVLLKLESE